MIARAVASKPDNAVRLLMTFIALMIAAVIGQTWWVVAQDREVTLASERANGLVAVRILEEHATQTLRDAESKLDTVAAAVRAMPLDLAHDETVLGNMVAQGLSDNRFVKAMQYINPRGHSWISSLGFPRHQADVSGREYVRYLLSHAGDTASRIGHPFQSRYDSQLVLPLGRNLYDRNGRHVGMVSIDMRLSYFADAYARVAKDNHATVALFADEGFIIVRAPFEARYVDRDISRYPVLRQLRAGAMEGAFTDDSLLDDELPRLYTYHKIDGFPVTTAYGRDFDSILGDWQKRTLYRVSFSAVMIVFICALTYFLIVHIRRLRQSEKAMRAGEEKFLNIFQRSTVAIGLVRMSDNCNVEVNDYWVGLMGFSREEAIGRSALELGIWVDPAQRTAFLQLLAQQPQIESQEFCFRRKDGRILTCLLSGCIYDVHGEKMFLFSARDITHEREMEKQMRELNTELEERVRVRTLGLEKANQELADALASLKEMQEELIRSEKMAALGSLVAGVAHELNTPIGNSVTVASTLMEQTEAILTDERSGRLRRSLFQQYLENAAHGTELLLRSLQRAAELVSSLKHVAVDQTSDQRRRFDLKSVLQEVVTTLAPAYKKTPYALVLDLAPGIVMDSFPGPLGQVVTNFVNNAVTHGFDGRTSGTMRLATRRLDEDSVQLVFSDDGVGIPEANLGRVFDPFFTTKLGHGGSGLGMNIVYNLVTNLLGGRIELGSTPGAGTTLTVVMPVYAPVGVAQELQVA